MLTLGIGNSIEDTARNTLIYFNNTIVYLRADSTGKVYKGIPEGTDFSFSEQDIELLKKTVPEINHISTNYGKYLNVYGEKNKFFWKEAKGIKTDYFEILHTDISHGRKLNILDEEQKRKVCIINESLSRTLFRNENSIGKDILLESEKFKIVGVSKNPIINISDNEAIFIPFSTYQMLYDNSGKIQTLIMDIDNSTGATSEKVVDKIKEKLSIKYKFKPNDYKIIQYYDTEPMKNNFNDFSLALKIFIWFVGISILLCGMIGVANVMIAITLERTKEIGIKKALGATRANIIMTFLLEAIIVTIASGIVGILAGYIVIFTISEVIFRLNQNIIAPYVSWESILIYLVILFISGMISGLYPAIKASKMNVVDAIRHE